MENYQEYHMDGIILAGKITGTGMKARGAVAFQAFPEEDTLIFHKEKILLTTSEKAAEMLRGRDEYAHLGQNLTKEPYE